MELITQNKKDTELSPLAKEYLDLIPDHPVYEKDIKPELADDGFLSPSDRQSKTFVTYGMSGYGIEELY